MFIISQLQRPEVQGQCGWVPVMAFFVAHRQPPSLCVLTWYRGVGKLLGEQNSFKKFFMA
jgi:hypothetical protein